MITQQENDVNNAIILILYLCAPYKRIYKACKHWHRVAGNISATIFIQLIVLAAFAKILTYSIKRFYKNSVDT